MLFNVSSFINVFLYSLLGTLVMLIMSALSIYLVGTTVIAAICLALCFAFALIVGFLQGKTSTVTKGD